MRDSVELHNIAKSFEWRKWMKEIPYLSFPEHWEVKAIPPFSVGIIRYNIRLKENHDKWASVYLDCYDMAGFVGEPYWEIYPYDDDCMQYLMNETDGLLKGLKYILEG